MPQTPQPWIIGQEGIVAPSVPYEQSRAFYWDRKYNRSPLEYQGELVAESCSFDDQVTIVHAARLLPMLLETLERVSIATDLEGVRALATKATLYAAALRPAIEAEGRANKALGEFVQTITWDTAPLRGLLPETATRARLEQPLPPYLPLRTVYDNIELAHLDLIESDIPF